VLRPFDERFASPFSGLHNPAPLLSSGSAEHSPRSSVSEVQPWETVRWTRLRKIFEEVFSESGRRNYGTLTCIAVSAVIAVGTSRGLILVFDYHQNIKASLGTGTKATESGAVTAIALSADHSTVAGGHAGGDIFTWEIAKPAKCFLHLPPIPSPSQHDAPRKRDGHMPGVAILHLEFLGTRHTALVSADERGMAFSHLASRGLGAISRTIHTNRILGRYTDRKTSVEQAAKKPSSVLAFASMPLGNEESVLDTLGLVAMLTPYSLVIVSTTPVAQTQHKASRPKNLAPHSALSAAVAWYPPMKSSPNPGSKHTRNPKLAYCWLSMVNILEVIEIGATDNLDKEQPPELDFRFKNAWQAEESIVALQWLNPSVIALITITQQLLLLDIASMQVTESTDLLKKHMYHVDAFSQHLAPIVESLEDGNASMHGVVADAFHMSFKAYKGRLFLLSFHDVSIGTLSNWADRLLALMERGDFVAAIALATEYYTSEHGHASLGLPDDKQVLQALVGERLVQMISASLEYVFNHQRPRRLIADQLEGLVASCFKACLVVHNQDLLFDEVFTFFVEDGKAHLFFRVLEHYIMEETIREVPPSVLKQMVDDFTVQGRDDELEILLCRLDPATMDLDQVTALCERASLYDALFYIWSQAIGDYTAVLQMLLKLVDHASSEESGAKTRLASSKIFPYLSHMLTGRMYPAGHAMPEAQAATAKCEVYFFIFAQESAGAEQSDFPRLRKLLRLDSLSFFLAMNEAFEDPFLNEVSTQQEQASLSNVDRKRYFGLSLDRQYILTILLQVCIEPDFGAENTIFLDMFVARSVAKFPQHLLLPGNVLQRILLGLCNYPAEALAAECQLSVEYLLSAYQPPDMLSLIPTLLEAGFFRVIKSIYRAEKQYSRLLQASFSDTSDIGYIFTCIRDYLGPLSELATDDVLNFEAVVVDNAAQMVGVDLVQTVRAIQDYAPHLHSNMIKNLDSDEPTQFKYLKELLDHKEPVTTRQVNQNEPCSHLVELYVQLLCEYDPGHVITYIEHTNIGNSTLELVMPAMENSGAVDAAVVLMARNGQLQKAFDRLLQQLKHLNTALTRLSSATEEVVEPVNIRRASNDLLDSLEHYAGIGVWLCKRHSQTNQTTEMPKGSSKLVGRAPLELTFHEKLWLELVDVVVRNARDATESLETSLLAAQQPMAMSSIDDQHPIVEGEMIRDRLNTVVHNTFTSMLTVTSSGDTTSKDLYTNGSFLRILRAFLGRASLGSPSITHLRSVLSTVFSAYTYQEELLDLAHKLINSDLYLQMEDVVGRRQRGWRPLSQTCAGCGTRIWGPSIGSSAWSSWLGTTREHGRAVAMTKRNGTSTAGTKVSDSDRKGKARLLEIAGINRSQIDHSSHFNVDQFDSTDLLDSKAVLVFSCRHTFHRRCLDTLKSTAEHSPHALEEIEPIPRPVYTCPLEAS
jgi:hypothetical protein